LTNDFLRNSELDINKMILATIWLSTPAIE
jgi:hypothetical protein